KTKEWRMDTVAHLTKMDRADTDLSFTLTFPKARQRTPSNRADFAEVAIALVNDEWVYTAAADKKSRVSPVGRKFLLALHNSLASDNTQQYQGHTTATIDQWRAECVKLGLIDIAAKPDSARALLSKHRRDL